ncbi:MAG TPA: cell division protein ZapA [Gemmatimonadales bacterium]|nr:cell division protein ZapA [Gemmatimonadales bacterium]
MSNREAVRVVVGGEELVVRSELPAEYTREVAAYYDQSLRRIRAMMPSLEAHKAAILAGLAVTDELFRSRQADEQVAARLNSMSDEIARLLPPTKRGSRNSGSD